LRASTKPGTRHYVPWTPKELFNIQRPATYNQKPLGPKATPAERVRHARLAEQIAAFHAQIAALEPYALVPNGRRKANGSQRFFTRTTGKQRATAHQLQAKVATQETVTLTKEVLGKHYQPHRWGTPEWIAAYKRRAAVEGVFGILKSRHGQGMTHGWIRVTGITATALMAAAALVSYNLQITRVWAAKNDTDLETLYVTPAAPEPLEPGLDPATELQHPGAPPAA